MKALFIVGHWNSGTTLLVDLLRKHPDLALKKARYKPNLEETSTQKLLARQGYPLIDFGHDYDRVLEHQGFDYWQQPQLSPQELAKFQKRWYRKFAPSKGKMLLWKNPWLFFYPQFIDQAFSQDMLRKVYILRDGHSQVVSKDYWKRTDGDAAAKLIARAHFWVYCMEWFFQTWDQDPDCLTLRYESVTGQPEASMRQICDHAGLDFSPLEAHLPPALENRLKNWNRLEPGLQAEVEAIIMPMQERIDARFPVSVD